jgi:hypothetical protein
MQLRRLNGCFGSVVAAWNLVLRVIFPKGDAESSAPGFRERPVSDSRFRRSYQIKACLTLRPLSQPNQ